MTVQTATVADFNPWLTLAREFEPLFGPMSDDPFFQTALLQAIRAGFAFCIHELPPSPEGGILCGGIVIAPAGNEIAWLAVSEKHKGNGYGKALLAHGIEQLDGRKRVSVQTFDETVPEGIAARKLYQQFGFSDDRPAEENPAGIPTVIMIREAGLR